MRKILLLFIFSLAGGLFSYALDDCSKLESSYNTIYKEILTSFDTWKDLSPTDNRKLLLGESLSGLFNTGIRLEKDYSDCLVRTKEQQETIKDSFARGDEYFKNSEWDKAIAEYQKILAIDPTLYEANYNLGSVYFNQGKYKEALVYYLDAQDTSEKDLQRVEVQKAIDNVQSQLQQKKIHADASSDDTFSRLQYYLPALNIPKAWQKIQNNHEVIVAVIDDGININHPDLTDHIWVEPGATYGSSKIKNFVGDELPDNFPTGEHGTMVAGIIAATTDNDKGIAGIARNVKIMPLRVSDFEGNAREEHVINALYYAIRNHANIINLSLGQSQFAYSKKYDEVIKLAYDKGIIVIIAAGNGDVLSYKTNGVNTTVNPLSPICNNTGNRRYSIGVGSLDQRGNTARWTNYGSCVSFFVPGENIFSTSVSIFNKQYGVDYDTDSGTSFSAPIVAGIIALGYNQFGYISPDIIYESLTESSQTNSVGNSVIDAEKYIDVLTSKQNIIRKEQFRIRGNEQDIIVRNSPHLDALSDAEYLATLGYIEKQSSGDYDEGDTILHQEVVALAMNILGVYVPEEYACRGVFQDVSKEKPNPWACRVIENAFLLGILPEKELLFHPEDPISLVEATHILLRAGGIQIPIFRGGKQEPWITNVIGASFQFKLVSNDFDFSFTRLATRGEVFRIARKILNIDR